MTTKQTKQPAVGGRQGQVEAAAAAIANARAGRRGAPHIANVLDILPPKLKTEVLEDAEAAVAAALELDSAPITDKTAFAVQRVVRLAARWRADAKRERSAAEECSLSDPVRGQRLAVAQTYEAAATELEMELRAGSEANDPALRPPKGGVQ